MDPDIPFEFTLKELRNSDISILRDSFRKLKENAIGDNGILVMQNGCRWINEEDDSIDEGLNYSYEEDGIGFSQRRDSKRSTVNRSSFKKFIPDQKENNEKIGKKV